MRQFCTYEQQIDKLREKGLIILDEDEIKNALKFEGYYNIINGYSFIFKDYKGFVKGTTFEHIKTLYNFDKTLRSIIYRYTLTVECHIKALVAHTFSKYHGTNEKEYLNVNNFNNKTSNLKYINELTGKCQEVIKNSIAKNTNKYREYIAHNYSKHGHIPFWILIRALTFGNTSIFYKYMKDEEKQEISQIYNLDKDILSNMLECLVDFRNIVAHGERTFCAKLPKSRLSSHLTIIDKLSIPRNEQGFQRYGRSDFLSLMLILKYLLPATEFSSFHVELIMQMDTLKNKMNPMIMRKIETEMGLCVGSWKIMFKVNL